MADERELGGPLDPLPDWQLFASVATQSELLDEVEQKTSGIGSVAEAGFDAAAVASVSVPDPTLDSLASSANPAGPPVGLAFATTYAPVVAKPIQPAMTTQQAMTVQFVDLLRPLVRSVFLRPLPTLADVAPDVEPQVRQIAPTGSDYRPGSIGKAIHGS